MERKGPKVLFFPFHNPLLFLFCSLSFFAYLPIYSTCFETTRQGKFTLKLTINGQHINGSPFTVNVANAKKPSDPKPPEVKSTPPKPKVDPKAPEPHVQQSTPVQISKVAIQCYVCNGWIYAGEQCMDMSKMYVQQMLIILLHHL